MSPLNVLVLLQKELRDSLRNRWLWLFAIAFATLGLALGGIAIGQRGGEFGFSRTMAGLVNLTLFLVPLFGLALGAQSMAGERERRTLPYLLTQPIGRSELLVGKFLGLALALAVALALGFGIAGLALAPSGVDTEAYAWLVGLALLLAMSSVSIGLLVSVVSRRSSVALGVALFVWFALVLLADLGLMGSAAALRLRSDVVFMSALANPLQVFKIAAVLAIRPSLEALGPAGLYGARTLGNWLGVVLIGLLIAWTGVPLAIAGALFRRREEP